MFKENIFLEESEKLINSSEIPSKEEVKNGIKISEITLDTKLSKTLDRCKGKYITITFEKEKVSENIEELLNIISENFKKLISYLKVSTKSKILFVGLGNKEITSDKFGYSCIEKIEVGKNLYKIYKDVQGITNIPSVDFIKVVRELTNADLVVVFDSLKAEHLERLGSTIQLSTGGLYPGSVLSDKKKELSKRTINASVLSIGVPTIINMKDIKENNPDYLVTTKDIDRLIDNMSSLLSIVINRLF